jgi:hypothetical protein
VYVADHDIRRDLKQPIALAYFPAGTNQLYFEQGWFAHRLANAIGLRKDLVRTLNIGYAAVPKGNDDGDVFHTPKIPRVVVVINT